MPDRQSLLPGNGVTKALLALLVGLVGGGGVSTAMLPQPSTEALVEAARHRYAQERKLAEMAMDLETIRRDMDDVLRQCTVRRRVR